MVSTSVTNETTNEVRTFFDRYYQTPINYNASEVDAVIAYFLKRGFDELSAINTSVVLLQRAKIDQIKVFKLIDTLKGFSDVELSNIVAQILNDNRNKTSALGFRVTSPDQAVEKRNVVFPTTPERYIQSGYVQDGYIE